MYIINAYNHESRSKKRPDEMMMRRWFSDFFMLVYAVLLYIVVPLFR